MEERNNCNSLKIVSLLLLIIIINVKLKINFLIANIFFFSFSFFSMRSKHKLIYGVYAKIQVVTSTSSN